jgi:hypothetical protein
MLTTYPSSAAHQAQRIRLLGTLAAQAQGAVLPIHAWHAWFSPGCRRVFQGKVVEWSRSTTFDMRPTVTLYLFRVVEAPACETRRGVCRVESVAYARHASLPARWAIPSATAAPEHAENLGIPTRVAPNG